MKQNKSDEKNPLFGEYHPVDSRISTVILNVAIMISK